MVLPGQVQSVYEPFVPQVLATPKTTGEYTWLGAPRVPNVVTMAMPGLTSSHASDLGPLGSGPLDGLVADGRAIGVRTVLDLTSTPPSHQDDPLPVVLVPDSLADLLDGFPTYGS